MIELAATAAIFLGAALLCALEPGPNFAHLSVQTMRNGRRDAVLAALGMHAGAYPYILAAALGYAGLLQSMPHLLALLKWIAGAYLVWLGLRALSARETPNGTAHGGRVPAGRSAFFKGLLLVFANPRTPAFYAAFPLLFVSAGAAAPVGLQLLVIAVLTNAVFLAVDLAFIRALDTSVLRGRLAGQNRLLRWIGGGLLIGFGIRLALARD